MPPLPHNQKRAASLGRTLGMVGFGLIVATITVVFSVQIILQAWGTHEGRGDLECREGIHQVLDALTQARQSAAEQVGELAALSAFRKELEPAVAIWGSVAHQCEANPAAKRLLRELEQLRFAEEAAVRMDAPDVARRRRAVKALAREVLESKEVPN